MGRRVMLQVVAALGTGAALGSLLHVGGVGVPAVPSGSAAVAVEVAAATLERSTAVPAEVAEVAAAAVLRIEATGCGELVQGSATAVEVAGRTVLLTNAHVVRGSGTVAVVLPDGGTRPAQVLGVVPGRDAAVLRLEGSTYPEGLDPAPIGGAVPVGSLLSVAGHPQGSVRVGRGQLTAIEPRSGFGGTSDVLLVDVQVEGGSSGGAVFDDGGRAVGLVAARDPRTGGAVAYPIAEVLGRELGPVPAC
jgi:S1-C subfamily serine protease